FVWSTLTCGKFTAPLLQQLSSRFSDSMIGTTFALQYLIVACLAGWGGALADAQERASSSWGWGRLEVLALALSLGTFAFLGHGMPEYMNGNFPKNGTVTLIWHIAMRCIYAVSLGVVAPCLDGLALAHLDCVPGASTSDFGKERMYGALWWGVGSLTAGIGIDYYGYEFLYAMLIVSTLASYVAMGGYLWGLSRDTTGVFKSREVADDKRAEIIRSEYIRSEYEYKNEQEDSTHENSEIISYTALIYMVCKTGYGRSLLFFLFTLSMGISVVDNLAFIFFDSLGASSTMDGWTVVFTVLFETPVFYVAPMLLERHSPGKLLLAAGIAYVIRVIGYTLVPDGKMFIILMLETLHGISYAGSKAGSVEFIARIIPEGYEAAGQGILIFVSYSGVVAGLLMAGFIQEMLGARVMFGVMGAIVSVGIIVLLFAECFHDEECQETNKEEGGEDDDHFSENCRLVKSESCASSASAFADTSTEKYLKSLKYDSLNKYVKDW
ncbi:hypothetical protein ACHAXR_009962, partial [Thalassiosira sp. AJA248-18]